VKGTPAVEDPFLTENSFYPLSPTKIRSCYAEGKRAGEALCVAYQKEYGIPIKIIRPFHSYGPGMNLNIDPRVFSSMIADVLNGDHIKLSSDGRARRCFCYISDAIRAFFYILIKGECGCAYNIGNEEMEYSIFELANELIKIFPEKKLHLLMDIEHENKGYSPGAGDRIVPDLRKVRSLGWMPHISIQEGFRNTVQCYKKTKFNQKEIK